MAVVNIIKEPMEYLPVDPWLEYDGLMTYLDKDKLDGIQEGAEANQNAFSNIVVGSTTIAADSVTDSVTLVAGSNVTLTPDASTDQITIAATDTTYSEATTSTSGLMSASDKTKLNGIAAGAEVNQNAFSNVKVGSTTVAADSKTDTLELAAGSNVTLTPDATNDKVTIASKDTTYTFGNGTNSFTVTPSEGSAQTVTVTPSIPVATTSANGLMSSDDKTKLNGVATGAEVNQNAFSNVKVGSTTVAADAKTDTLELAAGSNITLTPDATNDKVTIAATDTTYTIATGDSNGQIKVTPSSGNAYNVGVKGLGSAAYKNATTSVTSGSADLVTSGAVWTAIDNLPEPMVFKGSLGTGGTITTLPAASSANTGHTYKVITAGTYASQAAKIGDLFISDGTAWVQIPSADEPSGTVTSIAINANSPITVDSTSAITTSGTRTISHANSGVTAGTYRSVTVNATGHVTGGSNPTTIAGYGITDAKIVSGTITLGSNSITPLTSFTETDPTVPSWAKAASKPTYTAAEVGAATSGHTHVTSIATSTGTNQISLAANTKYAISAGGTSFVFTTPADTNTWRGIQDNLTSTSTTESLSANQGRLLANGSARDDTKLPLTGGTMTGDIIFNKTDATALTQVQMKCGTNDYGRIAAGGTASNSGWVEIATADDGAEPIYARQYSGVYTTLVRTATILDASGNTTFPGTLSIGNGSATMKYNSTNKCIDFVFA